MTHRLDPLLRPRSIAVVGASERAHSVGRLTVHNLLTGRFDGPVFPVNPGRKTVLGQRCYPALAALPEPAEHVVFCVADGKLEAALAAAIEHGARAVTIMSQLILEGDEGFAGRIREQLETAGILACGPNGMGFYNFHDGVWVCGFDTRENHRRGGVVTLISHSGAGMSGIVDCEERIDFNLAVSTGCEYTVDMADYLDFAVEVHRPRAVGLFMETARRPAALRAALDKALQADIPVVALKVGRTNLSARLARSHSGAVAGEDAAFDALFERYRVQRVSDMHELTTALMLFSQPHALPPSGGLVALHDSGGERQLLVDLADELAVPVPELGPASTAALAERLDPGLPPVNPLDGWGAGGPDADETMAECLGIMMGDEAAAIGAVVHDRAPHSALYPSYLDYLRHGHRVSGKPAVLVSNHQGSGTDPLAITATREGFPVVDGLRPFLVGARAMLARRDALQMVPTALPAVDPAALERLQAALQHAAEASPTGAIGEVDALRLLGACGLPCNRALFAGTESDLLRAAAQLGYPLVLKTAIAALDHKTEAQGVYLELADEPALRSAYRDLSSRLGPEVSLAPMGPKNALELFLGMTRDAQFGPLVIMGLGGIAMEAHDDTVALLPPFDAEEALRRLKQLRGHRLLSYSRGHAAPSLDAFAAMAARFSVLVEALADELAELDLNPVLVDAEGCLAVDALIVPARRRTRQRPKDKHTTHRVTADLASSSPTPDPSRNRS